MKALVILAVVLAGCTMRAELTADNPARVTCTDLRDGETFTFRSSTITNVRGGIGAPSSFDFVDDNGVKRTARSDQEQYIKCKPLDEQKGKP